MPMTQRSFTFGEVKLLLSVPERGRAIPETDAAAAPPFWAKVWPAALALCDYLVLHPALVGKCRVLELGAGLGLPGLMAASLGGSVTLSDRDGEAVALMRQNSRQPDLPPVRCRRLDWTRLPDDAFEAEVLLLSDVNYEPAVFEALHQVLLRFLGGGTRILLSTPQRLMAKPFIERLLPFVAEQEERFIETAAGSAWVSIFLLAGGGSR